MTKCEWYTTEYVKGYQEKSHKSREAYLFRFLLLRISLSWGGKEVQEGGNTCMFTPDSLNCTTETYRTL